jgi:hypothetical protein
MDRIQKKCREGSTAELSRAAEVCEEVSQRVREIRKGRRKHAAQVRQALAKEHPYVFVPAITAEIREAKEAALRGFHQEDPVEFLAVRLYLIEEHVSGRA